MEFPDWLWPKAKHRMNRTLIHAKMIAIENDKIHKYEKIWQPYVRHCLPQWLWQHFINALVNASVFCSASLSPVLEPRYLSVELSPSCACTCTLLSLFPGVINCWRSFSYHPFPLSSILALSTSSSLSPLSSPSFPPMIPIQVTISTTDTACYLVWLQPPLSAPSVHT